MDWKRLLKHLITPHRLARQRFPAALRAEIGKAVALSESHHQGELRFVVEGPLDLSLLWRNETARRRAVEVFSRLRVWDTEQNCGVLIYVQLVDRKVEILADRGIAARVPEADWRAICADMETAYRLGDFRSGSLQALAAVTEILTAHFPSQGSRTNELPDRPVFL